MNHLGWKEIDFYRISLQVDNITERYMQPGQNQNWHKALIELNELLNLSKSHFLDYCNERNHLPYENIYWLEYSYMID